jgi:hypothetical protein
MKDMLTWRKTNASDLAECLQLHPEKNGAEIIGQCRALKAWQRLFSMTHAVRSAVVELQSHGKVEIVGFGFGAFVTQCFAEEEVRNPQPGLNARLIERVDGGADVIASYEEVRDANTGCDLQQVILDTSWHPGRLDAGQVDAVRVMLGSAYYQLHVGYRFSLILCELVDARDLWHAGHLRVFQTVDNFDTYRRRNPGSSWNADRKLVRVSAASIRSDPHSIASELFQHMREPYFGFARGEQELLEVALDGLDDTTAAATLFVSVPAIKRRWSSIFQRVAAVMPELCPADGEGTRGIQKRQRILAYIRSHPEELRPFNSRLNVAHSA